MLGLSLYSGFFNVCSSGIHAGVWARLGPSGAGFSGGLGASCWGLGTGMETSVYRAVDRNRTRRKMEADRI